MPELVSCILPTKDRPGFFRQAIRYFLRQTHEPAELIVVDDGEKPVADLCPRNSRVQYVRLEHPATTGAKLNIGIRRARGAILQKLDDDDYYHPEFLRTAAKRLREADPARQIVAWGEHLVLVAGESRARYTAEGWAAGGTLCFSRELWERKKFRDVPLGVDMWFIADHGNALAGVAAPEYYMFVRHGRNTWTRLRSGRAVDDYFRQLPVYPKPLAEMLHAEDQAFYAALRYSC